MGYRNYIGVIPKREYNKIKSMDRSQLIEYFKSDQDEDWSKREGYFGVGAYDIGSELYEFGKYVDFNPPKKSMKTFFKRREIQKIFNSDNELFLVTPEFLEYVIDFYYEKIKKYYNSLVEPFYDDDDREIKSGLLDLVKIEYKYPENNYKFDFSSITQEEQNSLWKVIRHVQDMRNEWVLFKPFYLDRGDHITNSWKYEYTIFDLVRIYKSFDWKKNIMYYYGY